MTGRGATAPATTPKGRESTAAAAVARGESGESRAAIRRDGPDIRKGGGTAVRCRGTSRQLRQDSPSGTQDSAPDHATIDG